MVDGHHLLYVLSMWVPLYIVTGSDVRLISLMGTPVCDGVTNALLLEWAGIRVLGASGYIHSEYVHATTPNSVPGGKQKVEAAETAWG